MFEISFPEGIVPAARRPPRKSRVGPCRRHDATCLVLNKILDRRMNWMHLLIPVIKSIVVCSKT